MEKKGYGLATLAVLAVVALLVGGFFGHLAFPKQVDVVKEVKVEVPGPTVEIEKLVEVEKFVEVDKDWLNLAYNEFIEEYEDDDAVPYNYDFDQLVKHKFGDLYTVTYDEDKTTVKFNVELKFLDKDTEEKQYVNYNVKVVFDEEEEDEVEVSY